MNIRKAEEKDIPALATLVKPMWTHHADNEPEFLKQKFFQELNPEEYLKKNWNSEAKAIFVVEEDGQIIGCSRVEILDAEKFLTSDKVVYVDDVVVAESHRGKGVAGLLLQEAEKFAQEKNISLLQARVYTFNEASQKLFVREKYKNLYSEFFKKLI